MLTFEEECELVARCFEYRDQAKLNKNFATVGSLQEVAMKWALLSSQMYGPKMQKWLTYTLGMEKVKPSERRGDARKLYEHFEIKGSLITSINTALNMVQIRPVEDLAGYFGFAVDIRNPRRVVENSYLFHLSKYEMDKELELFNFQHAHGDDITNETNINPEYRLSLKIDPNDIHFQRWHEKYLRNDLLNIG